jgi:putative transposase
MLRHLRGHAIVLLDGGSIHKGPDVLALRARCPRLHLEWFPSYAPELNPDELVWAYFKATLANGHPRNLEELERTLSRLTKDVRRRPNLIRSFVTGSQLPAFL